MKKLLLITALLSTSAIANTQNEEFKTCKSLEILAGTIMKARQDNRSMSDLLEVTRGNKIATALVTDAYRQPAYVTEANKSVAVQEFKNAIFKFCYNERVAKEL